MDHCMRLFNLALGLVVLIAGLYGAFYFIANLNEFNGGDAAFSIPVPFEHPVAPVGLFMNLALAIASATMAFVGYLTIRSNWRRNDSR